MHGIKAASLKKIRSDVCNYFTILVAIKKAKCRLRKQAYLTFSSLLSVCIYNLIEISGAEDDNWCGVVRLTYGGTLLLMIADLILEKEL